jgi:hypothetical protein
MRTKTKNSKASISVVAKINDNDSAEDIKEPKTKEGKRSYVVVEDEKRISLINLMRTKLITIK